MGPITGGGDNGGGDTGAIIVPPDPPTVRSLDIGAASSGRATDLSVGIDTGGIGVRVTFVPTVAVTVPGLLLMLAVLAQSLGALAWIPVVRRWLGDRRRPRARQRSLRRQLTEPAGILRTGEVAERLMAALLKSAESRDSVGSNPTLSAIHVRRVDRHDLALRP